MLTAALVLFSVVSRPPDLATSAKPVALTPPMGWNSYDAFNYAVTEQQVLENAQYMDVHLKKLGWNYVVVDYIWAAPKLGIDVPGQNEQFQPRLNMDAYGRLLPDPERFPSSKDGHGFTALATQIHRMGFKFGIHLMRGIPKQAVAESCPIEPSKKGDPSTLTAVDAANKASTCSWMNHMYGLNMTNGAGQAYLDSLFRQYAAWGVDFVKVDDLSQPYSDAEIEGYHKAIEHCHRPIVLSLSPGESPIDKADHVARNANMWRLLGDFWDNWNEVEHAFSIAALWNPSRGPGHWPDLDMLPFGALREYGPRTGPLNTYCRFKPEELRTVMTLWCISQSPLMFGGNLPETDADTLAVITNKAVIDLDQHGTNPQVLASGPITIWSAEPQKGKGRYLAIFNRSGEGRAWDFDPASLGFKGVEAYDLWNDTLQPKTTHLSGTLAPHSCILLMLKPA